MRDSHSPPNGPGSSRVCPSCGETYDAGQVHVCTDEKTAGLLTLEAAPPPPPSSIIGPGLGEPDPLVGTTLADRYEILARVSQGGMGVVYKARHKVLNSTVAVKILLKQEDAIDQQRFLKEAQLASKINHPNIVYISDYGLLPDGRPYLVMEYLEGPTLSRILRRSKGYRIDMLRACKIAAQLARGMQVVHDKGIVHRDLKPENIFVLDHASGPAAGSEPPAGAEGRRDAGEDFVKIVDFGIAKDTGAVASEPDVAVPAQAPLVAPAGAFSPAGAAGGSAPSSQSLPPDTGETSGGGTSGGGTSGGTSDGGGAHLGLTKVGASLGTPRYMAPEQVDGIGIEPRTDQYALGCILYQMIGGQVPFSGGSSMALLSMHMFERPKPLRQRYPDLNIPESLDQLVMRMLAKTKDERFPSMRDLAAALDREIELLSVQRGEKVAISSGLAALLGGRRGTHIILRGHKLPLWAVATGTLALVGILSVAGVLAFRRYLTEPAALRPGELQAIEGRARQVLLRDLTGPSEELRLGALGGLGQTHDGSYRTALEAALGDPAAAVQGQAAEALGQLGDRQAVPALLGLLDRGPVVPLQVQLAAAWALLQLGEERGRTFLEATLAHPSEEARLRAASLLCGRGHPKAVELLQAAVASGRVPEPLRLNFLACLAGAGHEPSLQQLRQTLRQAPPEVALVVAARLAQLGQEDGRAYLREHIGRPGEGQLVAARFLSAPDEPQVAELFRKVLRDSRSGPPARLLASEGLGLSGQLLDVRLLGAELAPTPAPTPPGGALGGVELGAATAIVLLARNEPGALSEQSMRWARSALSDSKWAIRESAVAVIGDSTAGDAVPLLRSLLADGHPAVRRSAARALGRRQEPEAVLALRDGLRDSDAGVRRETLRALLRMSRDLGGQGRSWELLKGEAAGWVGPLAQSGSESEQTLARTLLFKLGDRAQLTSLAALGRSASPDVRQLVVDELGGLGRELGLLASLLGDTVFAVRFAAARQLAESGDRRAIPVLRDAVERRGPEALPALALLRKLGETASLPAVLRDGLPDDLLDRLGAAGLAERLAALDLADALPANLVVPLLKRLGRDVEPTVRQRVAEAAAALGSGPDGPLGLPILRLLASDADPAVRARAATLLAGKLTTEHGEPPPAAPTEEKIGTTAAARPATPSAGTPDAGPTAAAATAPEPPPAAEGGGSLIIEAPPSAQIELDHGKWQPVTKGPLAVSAGPHEIVSLHGTQKVNVPAGGTVTVKIPESPIEKLMSQGLDAHERKDLRKAEKLLEKAAALCGRKRLPPCVELQAEINFHLGQINESQERFAEAITAYKKVGAGRGHDERQQAAEKAVARLLPSVGQVVISKRVKDRCQDVTLYLQPGTHMIDLDGDSQMVKVKPQETVRLGSCQ